jgi:hypothetical protein
MLPETSYAAEWDVVGVDMVKDDDSAEVNVENAEEGKAPIVTATVKSTGSYELWKARYFFLPWNMAILRGLKTLAGQQSLFYSSLSHSS